MDGNGMEVKAKRKENWREEERKKERKKGKKGEKHRGLRKPFIHLIESDEIHN